MISIKPVLVSIDRPDDKFYAVTSIRSYVVAAGGEKVTLTKVNASAVVLRGQQLIRLTLLRTLSDPADVAHVQSEIADWARGVAQG